MAPTSVAPGRKATGKRGKPWLMRGLQWHDRSSSFRAGQSGARPSAPRLPRRPPGQFGAEAGRFGAGDAWIEDRRAIAECVSGDPEPWAASAAGELTCRQRSRRPDVGVREGLRALPRSPGARRLHGGAVRRCAWASVARARPIGRPLPESAVLEFWTLKPDWVDLGPDRVLHVQIPRIGER